MDRKRRARPVEIEMMGKGRKSASLVQETRSELEKKKRKDKS